MSSTTGKLQLWANGWFLRKHGNKQKVCWIGPSNEVIRYPEALRANGRCRINRLGQSGKLTSVTREQAAASTARNRTNQKALKSWRSDGATVMTDAEDINRFITTKLHRLTRVGKES